MKPHLVAVAVTAGAPIFEIAIPCEVFGRARPQLPEPWYDLRICAPRGASLRTGAGFVPDTTHGYELFEHADTVIVPAVADVAVPPSAELVDAIRAAQRKGARIASLCTGAFALAEAGILDDRTATTHWAYAEELARRYPAVQVDASVLYIDHGDVLTSAGTTAGIDLCLYMVAQDHGAAVANRLAKRMVAPAQRSGGQAQYVEPPPPAAARADDGLVPLLDWMRQNLHEPLTVTDLARRANVAERTLIRQFHATTGTTPIKWLTEQRVRHARQLLETGTLPIDRVGHASGLGGPANFRRHFSAAVGVAPREYRRSFRELV